MNRIKLIIILIISLTIVSCDKEMYYHFVISNESGNDLTVQFKALDDAVKTVLIPEGIKDTVYIFMIIEGTKIYERKISWIFEEITIKKDTVYSSIDYLLNENWVYKEYSDTYAEYLLTVDSTHFEYP
ncbi:MAG: hypothetical protein GQ564_21330 [Bacteroidales bacterium]|nr:hypothetical protein [Bacteroidales bacterium]